MSDIVIKNVNIFEYDIVELEDLKQLTNEQPMGTLINWLKSVR